MSRYDYNLTGSLKRALSGKTLTKISDDYVENQLNKLLVAVIGEPGKSPGKSGLSNSTSAGGSGASAYTSSQMPSVSSATASSSRSGGSGLLGGLLAGIFDTANNVANMAYNHMEASLAYSRQNDFYDNHLSMPAKVQEFQDAGLNPYALAGSGPGATSAPSVQKADGMSGMTDMLGTILNYKLQKENLGIQKDDVASKIRQREEEIIYQQKVNEYYELGFNVSIDKQLAEIDKLKEELNTEKTIQALNEAGVTKAQADAYQAFTAGMLNSIDAETRDAWNKADIALKRASEARNYAEIDKIQVEKEEILSQTFLNYCMSDQAKKQIELMGIDIDMKNFEKDHQKGNLIWQRVGTIGNIVGSVVSAASGVGIAASALKGAGVLFKGSPGHNMHTGQKLNSGAIGTD